ncbi:MAG: NAD-dependent DNA ligase LigA [Candidatus Doudnabacteria bacterium]|nr:NAD-dependent DNA ligase LigA [Candidatus Doudnabacteria bacterium]
MTKQEAKQRIEQLRTEVARHRYLYHVLDAPEISDAALDSLKHELQELENAYPEFITPDSPTQRVGGQPLEKFEKVEHGERMLSLTDAFEISELEGWEQRMERFLKQEKSWTYFVESKLDGLAVSLLYEDGVFVRGATRGNGRVGENITQNLKTIDAIPLRLRVEDLPGQFTSLPKRIEVRGEAIMARSTFAELNTQLEQAGEPVLMNPRNAAAGALRQLDPTLSAERKLDFYAWNVLIEGHTFERHEEAHQLAVALGFKDAPVGEVATTLQEVEAIYRREQSKHQSEPLAADGLTVQVNEVEIFERLGIVGKAPRGAIAYKYPAEQATTILEDVKFQVGRTGAITPVAILKPVEVSGAIVKHATLHNQDEIERKDVRIGDTVIVQRAGEVIPEVVEPLLNLRPKNAKRITFPTSCPACGQKVARDPDNARHECTNLNCPARHLEELSHFVSKKAVDIDGLGPQILEQLVSEGLVKTPVDLYTLTVEQLTPLERFADVAAENLVRAVQSCTTIPLARFLVGLSIRHVGEQTARDLAEAFGSLEAIAAATESELVHTENIGGVVARSISAYFARPETVELLNAFAEHGVTVEPFEKAVAGGKFAGMTVVFTGTLETLSRDEAKEIVRREGGTASASVSAKTDLVVLGENAGSKAKKAQELGVETISEQAFLKRIGR